MKTFINQRLCDLINVIIILCFQNESQEATVNIRGFAGSLMVNRDHVPATTGNDIRNIAKLTGLIHQFNTKVTGSA